MQVNQFKTNIVHFIKKGQPRINASYTLGNVDLKVIERYRYLGIVFNEYLHINVYVDVLSDIAEWALEDVIGKTKHLKDIGFKLCPKQFDTCVLPVWNID